MKGIYCLLINLNKDITSRIGSLGEISFPKGKYVYVGSAQNSVEKRLARHFSSNKKIRWHIDYFLAEGKVKIEKAYFKKVGKEQECNIAQFFSKFEESVKGFGCSDCKCNSHLFRLKSLKQLNSLNMVSING